MRVVLLRHGPAAARDAREWPDDGLRPLTPRGEQRTRRAVRGLLELLKEPPVAVLTSPLVRARATARIVSEAFGCDRCEECASLAPWGSVRKVVEALGAFASEDTVVLVGHEPEMGKLAGTLIFGAPRAIALKKAGACAIRFEDAVAPGEGALEWLASPKMLRRLRPAKVKR